MEALVYGRSYGLLEGISNYDINFNVRNWKNVTVTTYWNQPDASILVTIMDNIHALNRVAKDDNFCIKKTNFYKIKSMMIRWCIMQVKLGTRLGGGPQVELRNGYQTRLINLRRNFTDILTANNLLGTIIEEPYKLDFVTDEMLDAIEAMSVYYTDLDYKGYYDENLDAFVVVKVINNFDGSVLSEQDVCYMFYMAHGPRCIELSRYDGTI